MNRSSIDHLLTAGIALDDAVALRRISMTLHRWHELECGDSNEYGSWCITRGHKANGSFQYDDDGKPFLEHHHYWHGRGKDTVSYSALADRETGARKRLAKIMARYPGWQAYVQGDPRGCALYLLPPGSIPEGAAVNSCYYRGLAVYK